MTRPAARVAQRFAADLEELRELAKTAPQDAEAIVCALVSHLRAWRPESVAPLGVLPPPTEPIRDPRTST